MNRRSELSIPGIYTVTNAVSGKVYVGAARNIRKRWEAHRHALGKGTHRNGKLQRAWMEDGAAAFRFEVILDLSEVPSTDLAARLAAEELAALQHYPDTYNLMVGPIAGAATRQIWSQQRKAMWADPVIRKRIVKAMRKRAADPEHQERRSLAMIEAKNTPEVKAAVSAHMLDLWADPEHRQAQSEKRKANWQDEDYRMRQSESRSAVWQDPEVREKRRAAMRAAWVRRKARTAEP